PDIRVSLFWTNRTRAQSWCFWLRVRRISAGACRLRNGTPREEDFDSCASNTGVLAIVGSIANIRSTWGRLPLDPGSASQWLALLVNATDAHKPSTFLSKNGPEAPIPSSRFRQFRARCQFRVLLDASS